MLRIVQSVDSTLPVGLQLTVPIGGGVIGRLPESELCFPGKTVSRRHARLEPSPDGGWQLVALTSSNAVYLDGEVVEDSARLKVGSTFQIGGVVCVLVDDQGTAPVTHRLDRPVLLEVRDDGGNCTVHAGDQLLPIAQAPAQTLSTLVQHAGNVVHRWDLLDRLGEGTNLDKTVSMLRRSLADAVRDGWIDRARLAAELGLEEGLPEHTLIKSLIVTRRGHGYVLQLPPHRVRWVEV